MGDDEQQSNPTDTSASDQVASFDELLGAERLDSGPGWARLRMPIHPRHIPTKSGRIQGGIVMALADTAITRALFTLLPEGQRIVTVELKINFIAPVGKGALIAEGRIIRKGSTLAVGDVTVTDDAGAVIAHGLGTWMMVGAR
jgi:uncharacterized protein (TIGR00369 family)